MKIWQWVLLCVLGFFIFLVANAPATLLYRFIPEHSDIAVVQPSGTLFNGKMASLGYKGIVLDDFSWTLSPVSLFLGKATLDIKGGDLRHAQKASAEGEVSVSLFNLSHISASDLIVSVPIKSVLAQVNLPVQISAKGKVRVDIDVASVTEQCLELAGTGNWNNASIDLNQQAVSLGSFIADLSCEDGAFAAQVGGDNKFDLDATFILSTDGRLLQSGTFQLDPSLPQAMRQAAVFFGDPGPSGRYVLR
ncbi:MAG: type II secretion system protein N [Pseudomonadota bacterium]